METFNFIIQAVAWILGSVLLAVLIAVSVRLYQILSDVKIVSDRVEAVTDFRNVVSIAKTVIGFFIKKP